MQTPRKIETARANLAVAGEGRLAQALPDLAGHCPHRAPHVNLLGGRWRMMALTLGSHGFLAKLLTISRNRSAEDVWKYVSHNDPSHFRETDSASGKQVV